MKLVKRGIAVLLAALLIIPNLPAGAKGEVFASPAAAETVQFNTGSGVYTVVDSAQKNGEEAMSGNSVSGNSVSDSDGEAGVLDYGDDCFAEDGSYTIQIPETDPFFPYEVQFTCNGEVSNRWFMTPDDTVEVGGHIFRVAAHFTGTVMTQMSLNVAGKEVTVYPEPKDFGPIQDGTAGADIPQAYSLLPLEEKNLRVDLTGFTPAELTMVSVDSVFTGQDALTNLSDKIIWAAYGDDDYAISGSGDMLDLSRTSYWEMIVGAADQLAADNIRYQVSVYKTDAYKWLIPTVYIQEQDGSRMEMTVDNPQYYSSYSNKSVPGYLSFYLLESEIQDRREVYVSLTLDASLFANTGYDRVRIFEGAHGTAAEAETATEITDQIWQADMTRRDAGYVMKWYYSTCITMVMYDAANQVIGVLPMNMYCGLDRNHVSSSYLYYGTSYNEYVYGSSMLMDISGVEGQTFTLPAGYAANGNYRLPMDYYRNGSPDNDAVTAAYVGLYASVAEAAAAGAADIRDQLFGDGYTADFSQGVYISVFVGPDEAADQEIYYRYYITKEGTLEVDLSSGTAVTFLGLVDGNGDPVDCYVMNAAMDSYAEYNFPTILVGSDVDVTNLAPVFSASTGVNLYAAGSSSPEVSRQSYHDFSGGIIQYTASAENGENSKNYWLQVVRARQGAGSLYINSLADSAAETSGINSVREVMLDRYHSNTHDIVLINTGTEAIGALTAEVVSDVVELDEYWTLKGVYDLAGFSGTDRTENRGELPNMAKLRLKVKEGVSAGADISGTLTVKSGDTPVMILTLTGTVGDPCITTTEIPEAVKYVPYGTMIQNNNKYSWNTVSYSLYYGSLPEGMEIRPNGELYGVPREEGEFTFVVRMDNSSSQFSSSLKQYTLTVKENTDANVDGATDAGYDVTQRIPALQMGNVSSNQLFVSQGVFDQFAHVYLDGQMLEEGRDYTAESGSTRITILSQTLNSGLEEGTHTLGVEFRTSDTDTLKRAAQNFEISAPSDNGDNGGNNSDNNSGNNSDNNSGNNSSNNSGNNNGNNDSSGNGSSNGGNGNAADASAVKDTGSNSVGMKNVPDMDNGTAVAYTVVSGDTLWQIASRFYGDGNLWKKIFEDNRNVIHDANKIYVGQVILLYLPEKQDAASFILPAGGDLPVSTNADLPVSAEGQVYVVQAGDSLWKIAAKFYGNGRQWRKIYTANAGILRAPDSIYAGQVLIIPDK